VSDQPAPAPLDAERMQAILDGSPFIHFCGMRVTALDPAAGSVVLAMELRPELERRQGTGQWHGGAIAGLIDTAGDAAVALGLGAVVPTINFRVDYLRPATTRHLTATATVRRAGRTVAHPATSVAGHAGERFLPLHLRSGRHHAPAATVGARLRVRVGLIVAHP